MARNYLYVILSLLTFSTLAETTPLAFKPPHGETTTIECEFDKNAPCPKWAFNAYKKEHPKLAKETVFHYNLYLPEDYYANPEKRYPCIFITSPGGKARLGRLSEWVKRNKWIAIGLVESRNGSPEWLSNFIAVHDDAVKRLRIQEGMKYATGFSGGARCAATQVGVRPGFAGLILQGAGFNYGEKGYIYDAVEENNNISVYVIMGRNDSNKIEIERIKKALPKRNLIKYVSFEGGHSWAPAEEMNKAMRWMLEQLIYTTENKDVILQVFESNISELDSIENKFSRYEKLKLLEKIVKEHRLHNEPETKKHMDHIDTQLATLKHDEFVRKEIKAREAYDAVYSREEKMREKIIEGRLREKRHVRELERLISAYDNVAEKNADTLYGKKAEEKTAELENEKNNI